MTYYSTFNADSSENVGYNLPGFPAYLRQGRLSAYPDYEAMSHWHEDLEFIVVCSGKMTYNINGELVEISSGDGIFVSSRQLHYGFSPQRQECEFLCILLHPSLLSGSAYFQNTFVTPWLRRCAYLSIHRSIPWQAALLERLRTMFEARDAADMPLIVQREFSSIFQLLYQNVPYDASPDFRDTEELAALKRMLLLIQRDYAKTLTLAQIAAEGSFCRSKCAAIFKKYLRESPIQYLLKYRLERAAEQLLATPQTVSEIACAAGFSSASYFCECFRRRYGVTPNSYRKQRPGL